MRTKPRAPAKARKKMTLHWLQWTWGIAQVLSSPSKSVPTCSFPCCKTSCLSHQESLHMQPFDLWRSHSAKATGAQMGKRKMMAEVEVQVNTQRHRGDTARWAAHLSAEQQPSLSQQTFTLFHMMLSKCDIVKLIKKSWSTETGWTWATSVLCHHLQEKKKKGATKYLSLPLLLYWLSTQKHTPAYPRSPLPLKYESFFP